LKCGALFDVAAKGLGHLETPQKIGVIRAPVLGLFARFVELALRLM
jgi:hypothetical protein